MIAFKLSDFHVNWKLGYLYIFLLMFMDALKALAMERFSINQSHALPPALSLVPTFICEVVTTRCHSHVISDQLGMSRISCLWSIVLCAKMAPWHRKHGAYIVVKRPDKLHGNF